MTSLQVVAVVAAGVAALLHIAFFVLESVLFRRPIGRRLFGVRTDNDSSSLRLFAVNQGFYNLGLAIVVIVGVVLIAVDDTSLGGSAVGSAVIVAGCSVMALAGGALAVTAPRRMAPVALAQGIPPLIAIVAIIAPVVS